MTGLHELLSSEVAYRLGWTLLHSLWQGVAVALGFGFLLLIIPRAKANARYLAGCLSMLLIVLICAITFAKIQPAPRRVQISPAVAAPVVNESPASPETLITLDTDPVPLERTIPDAPVKRTTVHVYSNANTPASVPAPPWRDRIRNLARLRITPFLPVLAGLWLLGVCMLSLWRFGGLIATFRLRRIGAGPVSQELLSRVAVLSQRLRVSRPVRVLRSAIIGTPAVIGHLRPVVLLPVSALTGLTPDELEAILAHELAHIRRCDYLVNIVQTVIETLLFHHPAVWWISRRVRAEREHCCDDLAVAACGNPAAFARALTKVQESSVEGMRLAVAASGGSLLQRIRRIAGVSNECNTLTSRWPAGTVVLLVILATLAGIRMNATAETAPGNVASSQPDRRVGSAHQSDGERAVEQGPHQKTATASQPSIVNEQTVRLVAICHRQGGKNEWWTSSGDATSVAPEVEKNANTDGTYALFNIDVEDAVIQPYCLKVASMLKFKSFERITGTHQWLGMIDFPDSRRYVNMLLDVAAPPYAELFEIPLSSSDVGKTKTVNNYRIDRIEDLSAPDARSVHLRIVHDYVEGNRFVAMDKHGKAHPARETPTPGVQVSELTFDLPLNQLRGLARQKATAYWVSLHNVALREGLHAVTDTVIDNLEQIRADAEHRRRQFTVKQAGKPFIYNLPNGAAVQLVGVCELSDSVLKTWAPDGSPLEVPGIHEADVEEGGICLLTRMLGDAQTWRVRLAGDDPQRPKYRDHYVRPADIWVTQIGSPPGDTFDGFSITNVHGSSFKERARFDLNSQDVGKTKSFGRDGVESMSKLQRRSDDSFDVEIVFDKQRPAYGDYFAIDKAGHFHPGLTLAAWSTKAQESFPIALDNLVALVCREPVLDSIEFKGISLRPGYKTKVEAVIDEGESKAIGGKPAVFPEKPRPEWGSLSVRGKNPVLDLSTNKKLAWPDSQDETERGQYFMKLGQGDLAFDGQIICLRGAKVGAWKQGKLDLWQPLKTSGDVTRYKPPEKVSYLGVLLANGDRYEIILTGVSRNGLNFAFRKLTWIDQGSPIEGTVFDTEGKPLAGAQVVLASSSPTTNIINGKLTHNQGPTVMTDADGHYSFPSHPFAYKLVALHNKGFATKSDKELTADPILRLKPWARVEGTVRKGRDPWPRVDLEIEFDTFKPDEKIYLITECRATTDADGKYVMDHVPPLLGRLFIQQMFKKSKRGMMQMGALNQCWIEPVAGQTLKVDLGGEGLTIVGHMANPPGRTSPMNWTASYAHLRLKQNSIPYPDGMTEAEKQQWLMNAPQARTYLKAERSHSFKLEKDGRFQIDDVVPGTYEIRIDVFEEDENEELRYERRLGGINTELVVPQDDSNAPLDLGNIILGSSPGVLKPKDRNGGSVHQNNREQTGGQNPPYNAERASTALLPDKNLAALSPIGMNNALPAKRILHFPKDRSVGTVRIQNANEKRRIDDFNYWIGDDTDWEPIGAAHGDVSIPAGKRVQLLCPGEDAQAFSGLRNLKPDDIYSLGAANAKDDACLREMAHLTGLKVLMLPQWKPTAFTTEGLKQLTAFKSLERLAAPQGITDENLAAVVEAVPQLKALYFKQNRLTDSGTAHLSRLQSLEEIEIGNTGGENITDAFLAPLTKLPALQYVLLSNRASTDEAMRYIRDIPSLKTLLCGISDAGLAHLAGHPRLTNLERARIGDRGVEYLKSLPSLKRIVLGDLTDAKVAQLKEIRGIEYLRAGGDITDRGLADLAEMTNLKYLDVECNKDKPFTQAGFQKLAKLPSLATLWIHGTRVSNVGLSAISKLPALNKLVLMMTEANDEGLAGLGTSQTIESLMLVADKMPVSAVNHLNGAAQLKHLQLFGIVRDGGTLRLDGLARLEHLQLNFAKGSAIHDEDLAQLAGLRQLNWLGVGSETPSQISDAGVTHLAALTSLEILGISGPDLTDRSLQILSQMRRLDTLTISGRFTDEGLAALESLELLQYARIYPQAPFSPLALDRFRKMLPNLTSLETDRDNVRGRGGLIAK